MQTDHLNLDRSSGFGKNSERANLVQTKCTFGGGANHSSEKCIKRIRNKKEKARADGDSDNIRTKSTPHKCFRFRSVYHQISKCPNPPEYNDKCKKQVLFIERGNCALKKNVTMAII